ncbi:MAG: DUF6514 family protein [Clostridiales bacterium]|nr:DUF6514 family protein [Clostridiales bacterium]
MKKASKVVYQLIQTEEYVEDSGLVTTYGVSCREEKAQTGEGGVEYQVIPNISIRRDFVNDLINSLISHQAQPVHLKELIEDYLA